MNEALRKLIKRLHYPIEAMLVCVRWYATPLRRSIHSVHCFPVRKTCLRTGTRRDC